MKAATFPIEGMHCEGCAETVRAQVEKEPGVKGVAVSFQDGQARILFDPAATTEDRLVAAVGRLGFRVTGRGP